MVQNFKRETVWMKTVLLNRNKDPCDLDNY